MTPQRMHNPQRGVTIFDFRHQNAHRADIVNLRKVEILATHLPPDAVDMLGAAVDIALNTGQQQLIAHALHHIFDVALARQSFLIQQLGDFLVGVRLQVAERQVFQLPLQVANTEPVCQRRVDIKHFFSNFTPLVFGRVFHRPYSRRSLCQFDQRYPYVVNHGDQHLTHVLDLRFALTQYGIVFGGIVLDGADGGHAQHTLNQLSDRLAKIFFDFAQRQTAFPDSTVEHRGDNGVGIQAQIQQNLRHFNAHLDTVD